MYLKKQEVTDEIAGQMAYRARTPDSVQVWYDNASEEDIAELICSSTTRAYTRTRQEILLDFVRRHPDILENAVKKARAMVEKREDGLGTVMRYTTPIADRLFRPKLIDFQLSCVKFQSINATRPKRRRRRF